jgi:acetoin utilization deacetylase AcuC-like enzyme
MYVADTRVTVISVTYQRYTFSSTDTVGDDCPIFDGLFDYCAISAGGSMGALQL